MQKFEDFFNKNGEKYYSAKLRQSELSDDKLELVELVAKAVFSHAPADRFFSSLTVLKNYEKIVVIHK